MDLLDEARQLEAEGRIGSAIDLLERAVAMGDEDATLCKEIARMCLLIDERRAFANWCHEAIRLAPGDGEPYLMIGRELNAAGRWQETVESLEQSLAFGTLGSEQKQEARELLEHAKQRLEQWKHDHPGSSNL